MEKHKKGKNKDLEAPLRVRFHIIGNARMETVFKSQPCMVSKLPIIWKQTVFTKTAATDALHTVAPTEWQPTRTGLLPD